MKSKYEAPLTQKEQVFATENHYLVGFYLRIRQLPIHEWYDVVIFRYLLSVKRWFAIPELQKYSFKTIAFSAMRSAIGNEYKKLNRRAKKTVSLHDVIPGTQNMMYIDTIADNADYFGVIENKLSTKKVA